AHPTQSSGPRWSMGRDGHMKEGTTRAAPGGSFRDRKTWIQTAVQEKQWVPGPGAYKTEREFLYKPKDEVDTNKTWNEAAPEYSFSREVKETRLQQKDVKMRRNNGAYPKFDSDFTPGPGSYTQYTSFGAASGGHRQAYFGGTAKHNWDTLGSKS
ncbi:unnamed protein product, partial [Polarella glacialis]